MAYVQMELFPLSEADKLRQELNKVKKELDNVRRGMFSRHADLSVMICKLREDVDTIISLQKNNTKVI